MGNLASNLRSLSALRKALLSVTKEHGINATNLSLENMHEFWPQIKDMPPNYVEGTVSPQSEDVDFVAPAGGAFSKVHVAPAPLLQPQNIPDGITVLGVTGTMKIAPSKTWPNDIPATEYELDNVLVKSESDAPVNDKFLLIDNDGNIIAGYMYGDTFQLTDYDATTTEFSAVGWKRVIKYTRGDQANQTASTSYLTTANAGTYYLRNIRMCARDKIYFNGEEVWPLLES